MKRDMELIRTILMTLEEADYRSGRPVEWDMEDRSTAQCDYHVWLLKDAGLIEAERVFGSHASNFWQPISITWRGQEFLSSIRGEGAWARLKKRLGVAIGEVPFQILQDVAVGLVRDRLDGGA